MYPFPEDVFPPEPTQQGGYAMAVAAGRQIMRRLSAACFMLTRDVGVRLPNTLRHLDATGKLFKNWHVYALENDSRDDTAARLKDAAARYPLTVESLTLGLRHWPMVRSAARGADMARYRNRCRELARGDAKRYDVCLVVDADLAGWSLDGLCTTFARWTEWDCVAANGLRKDKGQWVQADAWAYRPRNWRPLTFAAVRSQVFDRGQPFERVKCAFGGLAVYPRQVYFAADYEGGDTEHVGLARNLDRRGHNRFFLNPSQIAVYRF